jgi:uncharacterized protein YqgC (DUF456 family)
MDLFALILAILFFLAGLAGILLPALPGTPLIFAGMLVYGILTGFETLDFTFFLLQGIAVALTYVTDYFATAIGTKKFGGSRIASLGSMIGLILGTIVLGPLGLVLGAFLGAVSAELISGKKIESAIKTGIGALIGFLGSTITKLLISIAMIIWFFVRI